MKSSSRPVTTSLAALPWALVVALTALNLPMNQVNIDGYRSVVYQRGP